MIAGEGFLGMPWLIWGALWLAVAAIYSVVWSLPKSARIEATRLHPMWRRLILRWAHSLVWVLLAVSCFLRVSTPFDASDLANGVSLITLVLYGAFLVSLSTERKTVQA